MRFDLLIKGGKVVDPGSEFSGPLDVAIKRHRIAAVDVNIPAESAFRVVDASGQYVTPGLVDLHTHIYHGVSYYGVHADPVAARSGVTTWLDVGSAGGYNFPGFREFIVKPSTARIYALLNISSIGLTARSFELSNLDYCDIDLCCQMIDINRDIALGVKARIDQNTTRGTGIDPLLRAREAAKFPAGSKHGDHHCSSSILMQASTSQLTSLMDLVVWFRRVSNRQPSAVKDQVAFLVWIPTSCWQSTHRNTTERRANQHRSGGPLLAGRTKDMMP